MTVSSKVSSIIYSCDGQTTVFDVPFCFLEDSDLQLSIQATDGEVTNLVLNSDYTVTGANTDNGGKVYLTHPAPEQSKLSILRVMNLLQETDYRENERFPAESHERALDKLTMEVQQLQEQSDRAIKVDVFSDVGPDVLIGQVERVWNSIDNIDIVANDKANMDRVALNIADVNTTATNIADVNTVAGISTQIVTVAGIASDVSAVAGVSSDITTVVGISSNVSTVAANDTNITTVATNISDVNTAATNMAAIQNAPNQANAASQSATNAANSATDSANSATASANSAQAAQDAADKVQGLLAIPIGTIFQSVYVDESLDIARQLNGQLISSTKFTGFREWLNIVQTASPNLFTTETNWQAEKTNSKLGQCGKFVVDDTAGTIRLPCVVNAQGLIDLQYLGTIKNESLPNITGDYNNAVGYTNASKTKAFQDSTVASSSFGAAGSGVGKFNLTFSASKSSSTYQDNAPVQQEAIQYPYYIQVATGVEETLSAIREYEINTPFFFGQSMWSDVDPNNASWLVSNGQYNAKSVYPDYYDWLLKHLNGVETTEGVTVKAYDAEDITDYDWLINISDQTFRLPLKTKLASGSAVAGNGMVLGLTNGTDNFGLISGANVNNLRYFMGHDTNAYGKPVGSGTGATMLTGDTWSGVTTDPTKSGIETSSAGLKLYFYVGDTVQDASVINAGTVLNDVAKLKKNKVNTDASNFTAAGKETVVGWGMPDWNTEVQLSGTSYTATYKCWLIGITNVAGQTEQSVLINGAVVDKEYTDYCNIQVPLDVGDVVTVNTGTFAGLKVYAMKGIGNA